MEEKFKSGFVSIIGRPNVGKSSLLNALLEEQKAIVTNIPGTTRDLVEAKINLGSVTLNLIDTAGIAVIRTERAGEKEELDFELVPYRGALSMASTGKGTNGIGSQFYIVQGNYKESLLSCGFFLPLLQDHREI